MLVALVIVAVGNVGAWFSFQSVIEARAHDRAEQIAQLHEAGCSTDATLRRFIVKQPPPNRPFYRRLGFTDGQIDVIAEAVAQSKTANLDLLGPRDPTCPKETP